MKCALGVGYRHLDCAHIYRNEKEIGEAIADKIADGTVKREELFVTSKLWLTSFHPDDVLGACQTTLKHLQLSYVDLYLAHWPVALPRDAPPPPAQVPLADKKTWDVSDFKQTWKAMESLVDKGLALSIGVSNFTVKKLKELLSEDIRIVPSVNQVESHVYLQQPKLKAFCEEKGILFEAYSPLGSPDRPKDIIQPTDPVPLQDPVVLKIAEKHKCTAAQVLISWAVHRGTVVLPKSVNASRIAENFDSYQVKLDEDDMKQLGATERGFRFIKAKFLLTEGQTVEQFWDNE